MADAVRVTNKHVVGFFNLINAVIKNTDCCLEIITSIDEIAKPPLPIFSYAVTFTCLNNERRICFGFFGCKLVYAYSYAFKDCESLKEISDTSIKSISTVLFDSAKEEFSSATLLNRINELITRYSKVACA